MNWEILGLNKYEAAVYSIVVRIGKGTAARISKESRVPYGRIYDILESLIAKNMLRIIPGKPKTYSIADPAIIEKEIYAKEKEFEQAKEEVKNLKRIYETTPEEAVMIGTGKRAWYEFIRELRKEPLNKINYSIKYTAEYFPEWVRSAKMDIAKGVDIKTLSRYDEETKSNLQKWAKHVKHIKTYPNKGVAFWISDDFVLIGLIKSNATVLIRDKAFIDMIQHLFIDAYKNAENIK